MRTAEGSCGTVLHRLIQEQLRYGNLTDTRTLLAIQQQALRGGSSSGGGGHGSPRSSLESLTQEETQYIQMSTRQDPQGQEHQGDLLHSESQGCHLYQLHGEDLPTYEEAKAHSQYLTSQKGQAEQDLDIMGGHSEAQWDLKREHARSLSERLMQLSLRGALLSTAWGLPTAIHSCILIILQTLWQLTGQGPNSMQISSQVAHSPPAAPGQNLSQTQMLMRENERLRKELEVYSEKASRLQKLELEIQRISEAYETLMKGSAKREALEKTLRNKLEAEIKRMHDFNRDLRDQLDSAIKQRSAKEAECSDQRHHMKEQQREREQLERQVQHLRISGEECQQRGELLEQALLSTQARNRQLVEELQRKRAYVEKAADPMSSEPSSSMLQQQLREREERVLALEADLTRWEQKYLEESTMRQFAMDAAATAAAQRDTTIIKHSPRQSPNSSFNEDLPSSIIQQRSRWEQGQLERQGLRLTRSVPSINNLTSSTESKGKSLSDDQTGAAALRLQPRMGGPARAPSRDCSTQSEEAPLEPEPTEVISAASSVETTEKLLKTCERISSSDAEVVEILI
ncbi:hypothetical protein F7725_028307 [Dissostichus mawsoni]|uniref:Angiomotin C-terminal domain-containing protein n=1 Tax=Dissostichus mawsoni TaxID=36200 RepID=A0A7J5XGL0_DISMA|nr:hypothetical protein F7725_028307 [Dissostichus mawsoni]